MLIAHVLREKGGAVHTLTAEALLRHAAQELNARKVGALVVLDLEGELVGVISERDIVREVARGGADAMEEKVSAAMTRKVITAGMDETIDECLERMTDRRIRHLPVIDRGKLVGIISIGDLVKHRIAAVEAEAAAMQAYITTH
ncbi:CBS domain-containing protein [Vitreimonas sp.]|uniref:CBS domain-containing protein n=1 Tax=Vitreimonas sp. TaxID=3069702 RepID=UPI002EDB0EF8